MADVAILGVPLNTISLVTLTVQNSALSVALHYSRANAAPGKVYSAASAVLINECLKGAISFSMAFKNARDTPQKENTEKQAVESDMTGREVAPLKVAAMKVLRDIFSGDCWKVAIPSVLYVIQNNLQFVAASHLDVPTFQVTYNLKILTTALFSVILLRRRLSARKWVALVILAAGVGIVQAQSSLDVVVPVHHVQNRAKGLAAVAAACLTSGLAGVFFEMVSKESKVDLWVRNSQLALFSFIPALLAALAPHFSLFSNSSHAGAATPSPHLFAYFGFWAWAVILTQTLGGLTTAMVIKYSDNVTKGFATSLAILLSFAAGVQLFNFRITPAFLAGSIFVIVATIIYSTPDHRRSSSFLRPPLAQSFGTNITSTRTYRPPASSGPPPPSPPRSTTASPKVPLTINTTISRKAATLCEPHTPEVAFDFVTSPYEETFARRGSVHGMVRSASSGSLPSPRSSISSESSEWIPLSSPIVNLDSRDIRRMV